MADSLATYLRIMLLAGVVLTAVVFGVQMVRAWRHLVLGQKMLAMTVAAWSVYITGTSIAAIQAGLQWNWRMLPLALGLAAFTAYLLEPWSSKARWLGRRMLTPQGVHKPVDEGRPVERPVDEAGEN